MQQGVSDCGPDHVSVCSCAVQDEVNELFAGGVLAQRAADGMWVLQLLLSSRAENEMVRRTHRWDVPMCRRGLPAATGMKTTAGFGHRSCAAQVWCKLRREEQLQNRKSPTQTVAVLGLAIHSTQAFPFKCVDIVTDGSCHQ